MSNLSLNYEIAGINVKIFSHELLYWKLDTHTHAYKKIILFKYYITRN